MATYRHHRDEERDRSEVGRIDYSPDYRSDKQRWDAGCAKYGTVEFGSAVNQGLMDGAALTDAMRAAERDIERSLLEHAVRSDRR